MFPLSNEDTSEALETSIPKKYSSSPNPCQKCLCIPLDLKIIYSSSPLITMSSTDTLPLRYVYHPSDADVTMSMRGLNQEWGDCFKPY